MNTAAIYARYSTDKEDPRSIEDQVRRCTEQAERLGYGGIAETFADAATSGGHTDHAALQSLLKAATKRGAFWAVLADDLWRLARSMGDTWRIVDDLAAAGVRVISSAPRSNGSVVAAVTTTPHNSSSSHPDLTLGTFLNASTAFSNASTPSGVKCTALRSGPDAAASGRRRYSGTLQPWSQGSSPAVSDRCAATAARWASAASRFDVPIRSIAEEHRG